MSVDSGQQWLSCFLSNCVCLFVSNLFDGLSDQTSAGFGMRNVICSSAESSVKVLSGSRVEFSGQKRKELYSFMFGVQRLTSAVELVTAPSWRCSFWTWTSCSPTSPMLTATGVLRWKKMQKMKCFLFGCYWNGSLGSANRKWIYAGLHRNTKSRSTTWRFEKVLKLQRNSEIRE